MEKNEAKQRIMDAINKEVGKLTVYDLLLLSHHLQDAVIKSLVVKDKEITKNKMKNES